MNRDPHLRASDVDRDRVSEALREHCAQGRLSLDEFQSRLESCYAARTYGELDGLLADLPGPDPYGDLPVPAQAPVSPDRRAFVRTGPQTSLAHQWSAWVSTSVVVWVIWAIVVVTGNGLQGIWPLWVSAPWGAVLLARALTGDAAALEGDRHARRRAVRELRRRGRR